MNPYRNVQWVVKVSKLCNLRCRYCYEYPFLGNPARMQLDQLERMFQHVAEYYTGSGKRMDFVWHGGEPLLLEPDYYQKIAEVQHRVFEESGIAFTNSVQTNLVTLTDDVLDLLRDFFAHVGVSVDLFGDMRVNVAGKPSQPRVLENMQRLRDERIPFGCITVLSRLTSPHVEQIYHFFEDIDTSFRLLPIYRTGYEHQQDALALTDFEIVDAFRRAVDLWLVSERNIQVRPIQDYIVNVLHKLDGGRGPRYYYDKLEGELVYIVDTDGSLYSNADAYDPNLCHGNVFEQSLSDMKHAESYLRAVNGARQRMHLTCDGCEFHGACSGYFMGEATPEQRFTNPRGDLRCGVAQPVQQYIVQRLSALGLVDESVGDLIESELVARLSISHGPTSDAFCG